MRFAPFALVALLALPACQPYGYGYAGSYTDPAYGAAQPAYGSPYYQAPYYQTPGYAPAYAPGYVAPPAGEVVVFGGERDDRRRYERRDDYRRDDNRGQYRREDRRVERPSEAPRQERAAPQQPQQRQGQPSVFAGPRGYTGREPPNNGN